MPGAPEQRERTRQVATRAMHSDGGNAGSRRHRRRERTAGERGWWRRRLERWRRWRRQWLWGRRIGCRRRRWRCFTEASASAISISPNTGGLPAEVTITPIVPGYDLVGSDGGVFVFGQAWQPASTARCRVSASTPTTSWASCRRLTTTGYFLVGSDGGVFAFGTPRSRTRCPASASTSTTSWASCRPTPTRATSWSGPTAGCSPSATRPSRTRCRAGDPRQQHRGHRRHRQRRRLLAVSLDRHGVQLR